MDLATLTPDALRGLLDGGPDSTRRLVAALAPAVQVRVARVLFKFRGRALGRDLRQETDDLCQEAFVELFENDARVLRTWDPSRGLDLQGFAQLVAERVAYAILRSGRRTPWAEDPTEELAEPAPESGGLPDRIIASREMASQLLGRLKAELTPKGWSIFQLLFLEEREVPAICEALSMNADAVYAWRSRLLKRIRALARELSGSEPRIAIPSNEARG